MKTATDTATATVEKAIATLRASYNLTGTPSEVIEASGLLPIDMAKRHAFATKELSIKDNLIANLELYTGSLPIGKITLPDGTNYEFSAAQLFYLHKSEGASLDKNLTNKCFKNGGIDSVYEPVGSVQKPDNSGSDPVLMAEFKDLVSDIGLTAIVRDGRSPIRIRCLVNSETLALRFPERLRLGVIESLLPHKLTFAEWIENDDDEKIGFVATRIKNA